MFGCIDDLFFVLTDGKKELESFIKKINGFSDKLKFRYESNEGSIKFMYIKPLDYLCPLILNMLNIL